MLSRVTAYLVEAGLLERSSDEGDRRAAWLSPTPKGKRLADRIWRERTDALKLALGALTDAEQRQIEKALPALEQLAEQLMGERP
jgi:DNA-binding MarR family transcriptional regulator